MADEKDPGVARFIKAGRKLCSMYPEIAVLWNRVRNIRAVNPKISNNPFNTIGVDQNFNITLDNDFVTSKSEEDLLFITAHEMMHPILSHPERTIALGLITPNYRIVPGKRSAAMLFNVAQDMVINAGIKSMGLAVPEGCALPPDDYTGSLDAESLWRALGGEDLEDPPGGKGKDKAPPQPGQGCGMEPSEGGGADGEGDNETDLDLLRAEVAAVSRNTRPGGALAHILSPKKPVEEDWARILKGAFRTVTNKRGFESTTYARPKKAGDARLPRYRTTEPTLGVIIDTSGSMSKPFIDKIVDLVLKLAHTFPTVKIAMVVHQEAVSWYGWINGQTDRKAITKACGKTGGTYAKPAYDQLKKMIPKVDAAVHLTDTYIENPWPEHNAGRLIVMDFGQGGGTPIPKRAKAYKCEPYKEK